MRPFCFPILPHSLRVSTFFLICVLPVGCRFDANYIGKGVGWVDNLRIYELPPSLAAQNCCVVAREYEKQKNWKEAIRWYETARELDPNSQNVARQLATLYDKTTDPDRATQEYELAIQNHPQDAQLRYEYAMFHYRHEQLSEAEAQFRQTVHLKSDLPEAWHHLAMTLAKQGQIEESLKSFEKVLTEGEARFNVGLVLREQGKEAEAKEYFREALEADPTLDRAKVALGEDKTNLHKWKNEMIVPVSSKEKQELDK
jgi:Tfp pilus assembly protein PilF